MRGVQRLKVFREPGEDHTLIPAFRGLKQVDLCEFEAGQQGLQREFQAGQKPH